MAKITAVKCIRTRVNGTWGIVKILTDQPGLYGIGSASDHYHQDAVIQAIETMIGPRLIGRDADRIEDIWQSFYTSGYWRNGAITNTALGGIDMALWDIKGKEAGMPVYQLLGGKYRDEIPTYGSAAGPEAAQAAIEDGFTAVKTGFSKGRDADDFDRIEKLSEAIGSKGQLLVDSLGAFKLHEAIGVGRKLDALDNIGWFEDALMPEDQASYSKLAEALDTAVCVGEMLANRFQFRDLFAAQGADVINPDVSRACGITECKRIADMADTFGILWSPHVSSGLPPYVAASIHLAVATPNAVIMEGGDIHKATDVAGSRGNVLLKEPITFRPGFAVVPEGPGLGIEFDEKELKKVIVGSGAEDGCP